MAAANQRATKCVVVTPVKAGDLRGIATEHQRVSDKEERCCSGTEDSNVHCHCVCCILGTHKSGFQHRETGLHEHHK